MAKAVKKPRTAGEPSPAVLHVTPVRETRYRVNRPFSYADEPFAVGDIVSLIADEATRVRLYAGADALIDVAGANG